LLISAVVDFFLRLSRPAAAANTMKNHHTHVAAPQSELPPTRTSDPVFVQGTLCERVVDADDGHEFFVCIADVDDDDYSCRCVAKDGRWSWFCTQRRW
jgi:hypothetical protein